MAESSITRKLAQKLKILRKKAGLTQEAAAEAAGISVRHYQQLESEDNKNAPQLDTLEKLAKALKTTLKNLIDV